MERGVDERPAIIIACDHGDVDSVQALLDEGCDVNILDDDENTPLHTASASGQETVVRLLIKRGAGLDKRNLYGWTPLLEASRYGHSNVAALLIQHQADIHAKNHYGACALTLAARGGHIQTVGLLAESGVDLNTVSEGCEFTPLLAAALHGHDAVLRFLLDRGCDVNYRTPSSGLTPLMLAALNGHMTTAQILIEKGADPNVMNVCDTTALGVATVRGKREVRGYLDRKTTNKPQVSPDEIKPDIIEAAKQGDMDRIREILDQNPGQKDASSPQDGATPLMFAAMTGRLNVAELLIQRGCDINKQDLISGWTALMQATYHGKKQVAVYLLSVGAEVSIQAKNGCTVFDMATLIDDMDTDLMRILASKSLHVTKPDKSKKGWSKNSNGAGPSHAVQSELGNTDENPKPGLKGWWNRMSNRFRNLKMSRNFGTSNRLAPMPLAPSTSVQDLTLKSPLPSQSSPLLANKGVVEGSHTSPPLTSYQSLLLETKKTASLYTLDINPPSSSQCNETLKPVKPPFLPPPSFALDGPEHSQRYNHNWRTFKSMTDDRAMSTEPSFGHAVKYVASRGQSGSVSARLPSSSDPATPAWTDPTSADHPPPALKHAPAPFNAWRTNPPSAATSPRKQPTAGQAWGSYGPSSGFLHGPHIPIARSSASLANQHHSVLFQPRKWATTSRAWRGMSANTTSPNSSTSGSSSLTPKHSSRGPSSSSRDSTTSTLTPSPSPTPGKNGEDCPPTLASLREKESGDDELSSILKKLSLEKYSPIFEEQEVDMEAFLTLDDKDLTDLGIPSVDSRRQILKAIGELNSGKGRERQQFVDTITLFNTTLKARTAADIGPDGDKLLTWTIPDETDCPLPGSKSRSS